MARTLGRDPVGALPAWSLDRESALAAIQPSPFPMTDAREWACGGAMGEGVRVCVVDSGIDSSHPLVGRVGRAVFVGLDDDGEPSIFEDQAGDVHGHGTACAGIIRSMAPACEIDSVRALGPALTGPGVVLLAGLKWAIEEGYDVINLSLSMSTASFVESLRELADLAYFQNSLIVAAADNMPVSGYPWRLPTVISVASHWDRSIRVLRQRQPASGVSRMRVRRRSCMARSYDGPRDRKQLRNRTYDWVGIPHRVQAPRVDAVRGQKRAAR